MCHALRSRGLLVVACSAWLSQAIIQEVEVHEHEHAAAKLTKEQLAEVRARVRAQVQAAGPVRKFTREEVEELNAKARAKGQTKEEQLEDIKDQIRANAKLAELSERADVKPPQTPEKPAADRGTPDAVKNFTRDEEVASTRLSLKSELKDVSQRIEENKEEIAKYYPIIAKLQKQVDQDLKWQKDIEARLGALPPAPHLHREGEAHCVYVTGCSEHEDIKAVALDHSWKKVGNIGRLTRIVVGCNRPHNFTSTLLKPQTGEVTKERFQGMANYAWNASNDPDFSVFVSNVSVHVSPGAEADPSAYAAEAIEQWLRDAAPEENVVVLLDARSVFLRPLTHFAQEASEGVLVAQRRDPGPPLAEAFESLGEEAPEGLAGAEPEVARRRLGPPYLVHRADLGKLLPAWKSFRAGLASRRPSEPLGDLALLLAALRQGLRVEGNRELAVSDTRGASEAWSLPGSAWSGWSPFLLQYSHAYKFGTWVFDDRYLEGNDQNNGFDNTVHMTLSCRSPRLAEPPSLSLVGKGASEPDRRSAWMIAILTKEINNAIEAYLHQRCNWRISDRFFEQEVRAVRLIEPKSCNLQRVTRYMKRGEMNRTWESAEGDPCRSDAQQLTPLYGQALLQENVDFVRQLNSAERRGRVAFAVIMPYGVAQAEDWQDAFAVAALSLRRATKDSRYDTDLIALVSDKVKDLDHERELLKNLGYEMRAVPTPVDIDSEVRDSFVRDELKKVLGEYEQLKYYGAAWTEYDRVVILDGDTLVLQSIDELFEVSPKPGLVAAYDHELDAPMATFPPVNSGFLVFTPSRDDFERITAFYREGDFGGMGWKGWGTGWTYGTGSQGMLSFYYNQVINGSTFLNGSSHGYSKNGGLPFKGKDIPGQGWTVQPKDSRFYPVDRSKYNVIYSNEYKQALANGNARLDGVKVFHFTGGCVKPWKCSATWDQGLAYRPACRDMTARWWSLREELMIQRGYRKDVREAETAGKLGCPNWGKYITMREENQTKAGSALEEKARAKALKGAGAPSMVPLKEMLMRMNSFAAGVNH